MGRRRFVPLILVVVLGALVLAARLFTIAILERELWTAQAEALVREGSVEPYTRGEIFDAQGRVLARDVESYCIEVDYRDFRRGHALGVVAHARSTLERRPVPLAEARGDLAAWAAALGRLSRADLERFAQGGELQCGNLRIPATEDSESEARGGRALDLAFYATALFDLTARERSSLKRGADAAREIAFTQRVAAERRTTIEAVEASLAARCAGDLEFLAGYADLWARDNRREGLPLDLVLDELERWRNEVEDGAARDLFEAAAGFPAGRVDPATLAAYVDLGWIQRSLRWDGERLAVWAVRARLEWLELRDGPVLDFAVERVRRDLPGSPPALLVLRELAPLFVASSDVEGQVLAAEFPWREDDRPLVIGALDGLFTADAPRDRRQGPRLPHFDSVLAEDIEAAPGDAGLLGRVEFWRGDGLAVAPELLQSAAEGWRARLGRRPEREDLRRGFETLFLRLEECFQEDVRQRLEQIWSAARDDGDLDSGGKLAFAEARLDRAEERLRYILKDRGSRHFVAVARPSYALVNLLTRYPRHLRGFEVVRQHMRVHPTRDAEGRVVGRLLVGRLAPPSVSRRLSQREIVRQIAMLESQGGRDEAGLERLAQLRASLDRPDEKVGAFGLERWFEPELVGRNGFHEDRGLSERERSGRALTGVDKIDGQSITTTLNAAIQAEAEYCLEHPEGDRKQPDKNDPGWLARPTGAIVLLSPEGDVIAAASTPLEARTETEGRSPIGDQVRERTLTKPDFQPPGSVFKPFVAAFALDRLNLDPNAPRSCSAAANPGGRGPGYGGVHCHETVNGHGTVDLHRALTVSCNSYFAWLGEQYDAATLQEMAHQFGFGEPTGVRAFADGTRSGLVEDTVPGLFRDRVLQGRSLCEAGNGLSVVEATPMQVARATAGLATGVLPELRLVSRIGERELPHESRAIDVSPRALQLVRAAMEAVAADPRGSARASLSPEELGFAMAVKTGSADVTSTAVEDNRVLKHTWVAGWFPAEDPVGILVVFEYRTTQTSSHTAAWLARQFLDRPAVRAWLAERTAGR